MPSCCTASQLAATYRVGTPYVDRAGSNRQAVAEFQDQWMNITDLKTFFDTEVPNAQPGDEAVHAFKGAPYRAGSSIEAALDIQ